MTNACSNSDFGICLTTQGTDFQKENSKEEDYGYGFWSQYLSMSSSFSQIQNEFPKRDGYALIIEQDQIKSQNKLIYYQQHQHNSTVNKTIILLMEQQGVFQNITDFMFDNQNYEGMWIYHYFAFLAPNQIQIIIFNTKILYLRNLQVNLKFQKSINLNLGGNQSLIIENKQILLSTFLGRLSEPDTFLRQRVFLSEEDFTEFFFFQNKYPSPSSCDLKMTSTNKYQGFKYSSGLITMESWIQLNYSKSISVTVSLFGIEFPLEYSSRIKYQKIVDLQYFVNQGQTIENNGIYFQMLEKEQNQDYEPILKQYFYYRITDTSIPKIIINSNLKEWHFVLIQYGILNGKPVQKLNMWFHDGKEENQSYNNPIYQFDDLSLQIRAGSFFEASQNGVEVKIGLTKIYTCQKLEFEPKKQCHYSCLNCDGPNYDNCLSCQKNRLLEDRQCKCNLEFVENDQGACQQFQELYSNSNSTYIKASSNFYRFGMFPIIVSDKKFYLWCPHYAEHKKPDQRKILYCIECFSDPEKFSIDLKCSSDYIVNKYGEFEIQERDPKDMELFIPNYEQQSILLCSGCQQICNPNIDYNCYLIHQFNRYFSCSKGYYYSQGLCLLCNYNCKQCIDSQACTECYGLQILNPNTSQCINCPNTCQECEFDQSLNLFCKVCPLKYSLFQGQCLVCGQFCLICEYTYDNERHEYYNRCIKCIDDSLYFLSLDAVNCLENKIKDCRYVVQFHKNFNLRKKLNTMLLDFQRYDEDFNLIMTYCALCSYYSLSEYSGRCELLEQGIDCMYAYEYENWYEFKSEDLKKRCGLYAQHHYYNQELKTLYYTNQMYNGCWNFIQNCHSCFNKYCLRCFAGFYTTVLKGQCNQCPQELNCLQCQQQSKKQKNAYKIWYKVFFELMSLDSFINDVFGKNQDEDELEILCTACDTEYELYETRCIKKCPVNCEICEIVNGENSCVKCLNYPGKPVSLYKGKCIECPRYCQLCYPKNNKQLSQTNSNFDNEKLKSTANSCLLLEQTLNNNDFTYDSDYKQFFKSKDLEVDPNSIDMSFNLYCDKDQFTEDLENSSDQEYFIKYNIIIDDILQKSLTDILVNRIENNNVFSYYSASQIKYYHLELVFKQNCTISYHSILKTNLPQMVYFINQPTLTINGNNNYLIMNNNLEIVNYVNVIVKNLNILVTDRYFIQIFSNYQTQVIFNFVHVTTFSGQGFQFILANLKSLNISECKFFKTNLQHVESVFLFLNGSDSIDIEISNFLIEESSMNHTNLFSFTNEISLLNIQIHNLSLIKTQFIFSSILISSFQFQLGLTDLNFYQSDFQNISPLFQTSQSVAFIMKKVYVNETIFQNTILFQVSKQTQIDLINVQNSKFVNSSILASDVLSLADVINVSLSSFAIQNATYDTQNFIIYVSSKILGSRIQLTNWKLSYLKLSNEVEITTSTFKPLINLRADFISLQTIVIIRTAGISEFYLGFAEQINIYNMSVYNGDNYKSLVTNKYCKINFSFYQFVTVLYIEKTRYIKIENMFLSELIIFDLPLIHIISIETQLITRQESIQIDNFFSEGCIIQKTKTVNEISIIYVSSQQEIEFSCQNCVFKNNFYHTYISEQESNSALALYLLTEKGDILIIQSSFNNNYLSQSQNSLIFVNAANLVISNTNFYKNNHFTLDFIKNIDWGYQAHNITINSLATYFPVQSLSGNGRFQISKLRIKGISIFGGFAKQSGCFYLTMKDDGIIQILDSNFTDIVSTNLAGCMQIEDQGNAINAVITNSLFKSIYTVSEGGGIYFQPKSANISFILSNITIINTYSLTGAFINLKFTNYLTQSILIQNCRIDYTFQGFADFIQKLGTIDVVQKNELITSTAVFVINYGKITLKNVQAQLCIISLLESIYTNQISLTQVKIINSYYGNKQAILISCSLDELCRINVNDLEIKQFSYYEKNNYSIKTLVQEEISQSLFCNSKLIVKESESQMVNIDFREFGEDQIEQIVLISSIKSNDKISIKNSYFHNNICSGCQNGLIQLNFDEQITVSPNFQLQNILITENNCGKDGCLNFYLDEQQVPKRMLQQIEHQVNINQLMCRGNQAVNGGCIYSKNVGLLIKNSIISDNNVTEFGGGIFYSGDVLNLRLFDNLIMNNLALSGGALYIYDNISPELNKTNNYLESNQQTLSSNPTSLTVTLDNYESLFFNYHEEINYGFISTTQYSNNQVILSLPSGQEISKYKYFNMTSQEYLPLNMTFRIFPLNNYLERLTNLISSECSIKSGYFRNNTILLTNNFTNYNSKQFNETSQDYNFDDLIIYFLAENPGGYLILLFNCNSIQIPIYQNEYPYQIAQISSDYTLQVTIQTFKCQLGEYKDPLDDSCHLCDIQLKQYSVKEDAINCRYMDEETILQITPAQLKLKNGVWRPFIHNEIIEKCRNKFENCLGGWKQGDETCKLGQIGARCESCDSYNLRGQGHFSQKSLYTCGQCQETTQQIFYIIATSIWMLISLHLTTKGIETMIMEIQKNRVGNLQLIINNNKQTGPYIKMFTNYLQSIAIILNFNVNIPFAFKSYFTIVGNPQQQLLLSTDCLMVSQFKENIMYIKIIQCLINPIIYGLAYLFIYLILVTFKMVQFNKLVISTVILYLFCYFSPQAIQLLIQSLSYQTISGIDWIQANLAYQFNTFEHQQWIPYFITLLILLGFIIPAFLLFKLFHQKKELFIRQLRNNWGFLILEYQPKAFYWEFIRIFTRELIIIAITFYQDSLILKCALVLSIMLFYQQGTTCVKPYKTKTLNNFDIKSSLNFLITTMSIFALAQSTKLEVVFLAIIIFLNCQLSLSLMSSLLLCYLQAYEEILDKIKEAIKSKISDQGSRSSFLQKLLVNKTEKRKNIRQRFQRVKAKLFENLSQKSSKKFFGPSSKQYATKHKFQLPASIIFTSNSDIRGGKSLLTAKI